MEVQEAVAEFCHAKHMLSSHTQRGYSRRLAVFADWCEAQGLQLEALTARHVRAFIDAVSLRTGRHGGPLKQSTLRIYALTVKVFLSWLTQEQEFEAMVSSKVVKHIQLPKSDQTVIETFSPEQIEALFRATEKQPFPVRDKALLAVLLDTGVRAAEFCGLTLSNIWLEADDSYIKVTGKGRKEREIALGKTARIALRRYITRYRKPKNKAEQHVFLSRTGEPLTRSGLDQVIRQLAEQARIKTRASPHVFRHTYAVQYLLNGGDLYKLSRTMGHSSVKITERYVSSMRSRQARQGQSVLDHLREQ
jgi:site-specific recombinase XerD